MYVFLSLSTLANMPSVFKHATIDDGAKITPWRLVGLCTWKTKFNKAFKF